MDDRVGQQLGNYQLICVLGEGAFAKVYLGQHLHLHTQAALKVLHTQLTSDDVDQFRTEAHIIAHLVHPHIVRVLEFGVEGKTPFLVMDYAPYGTLRKRYPRGTTLPLNTIISYVKQVAGALQYAHDQKLIHRDVKPENMLIGRNKEILLSDFGIALVAQSSRYQSTQEMAGTMAYMAPEQIQGKPRPASDQYALAIVVYEWISGTRPFQGSLTELVGQHLSAPPPPLQEKVPTVSPAVEQVVLTALAKDPKQRFASIQVFAMALEQASQSVQSYLPAAPTVTSPLSQPPQPKVGIPPARQSSSLTNTVDAILPDPTNRATSPRQSLEPTNVVAPSRSLLQPTVTATSAQAFAVSPLSTEEPVPSGRPQPSKHRISRRAMIVGLAGLTAGGSSLTWFIFFQGRRVISPSLRAHMTSSPALSPSSSGSLQPKIVSSPMFGINPQHTHFNSSEQTLDPSNVSRLVLYWTATTNGNIYSSPAVVDGIVYITSEKLYAFDATTGQTLWSMPTGGGSSSSPAVANGVVYVGSGVNNTQLYAFNATTGKPLWSAPTSAIQSSPTVVDGVVYVGSVDKNLYAFNATTGAVLWSAPTAGPIYCSPAVANGVVYIGSYNSNLYAFNASTGAVLWPVPTLSNDLSDSSPAVVNGIVYIASAKLYAFNTTTGKLLWSASIGSGTQSSPAVANGVVYIGSGDNNLYGFNATTGKLLWSAPTGGGVFSSPTVANGVVYVGSYDAKLHAFNATTGAALWSATTGGFITGGPAVLNGVVYVGTSDHLLYAFHLPDSTP